MGGLADVAFWPTDRPIFADGISGEGFKRCREEGPSRRNRRFRSTSHLYRIFVAMLLVILIVISALIVLVILVVIRVAILLLIILVTLLVILIVAPLVI